MSRSSYRRKGINTYERLILERRINEGIKFHGSSKKFAQILGIDEGYLSRIRSGQREPGDYVLEQLGLRRVITYVRNPPTQPELETI